MTDNIKLPPIQDGLFEAPGPIWGHILDWGAAEPGPAAGEHADAIDAAITRVMHEHAREAVRLNAQAVPDGWVLVPKWPTTEMLAALSGEWHSSRHRPDRYAAMLSASPAAPQPAAQQGDTLVTMPDDIERMAVNRYRPVPSGVLAYKVVGGDGDRSLFYGTKDECQIVARKLTEAFLDGAHVALAAQAQEAAPSAPQPAQQLLTEKDALLRQALDALENGVRVRNAEGGTKYQPPIEEAAIDAIRTHLGVKND